jgi:hypothetical protein
MNVQDYLLRLRDCVCLNLQVKGQGPVCECLVAPGASVAWDYCGECGAGVCGMAYIQVDAAWPYSTFPSPDLDFTCRRPLGYSLSVGILRCAPSLDDDGELPDGDTMTAAALGLLHDKDALFCAVRDCGGLVAMGTWSPQGPEGGCHGGEWQVFVDPAGA